MSKTVVDRWRECRDALEHIGIKTELDEIVNELTVLCFAVKDLQVNDTYRRDGIASLIKTVTCKLSDLSHGRDKDDVLP